MPPALERSPDEVQNLALQWFPLAKKLVRQFVNRNPSFAFAASAWGLEDLQQQAWFSAVKTARYWTPCRGKFGTLLGVVIWRDLGNLTQRTRPTGEHSPEEVFLAQVDVAGDAGRAEDRGRLAQALELLTPRQRRVIRLHFGLYFSAKPRNLADVAREMGVSKQRVHQIFLRALHKLKKHFAAACKND